jgi:hypothetical protein
MDQAVRIFYIFVMSYVFIAVLANFIIKGFPKLPGDLMIQKPGLRVYVPFVSPLILSAILVYLLNTLHFSI